MHGRKFPLYAAWKLYRKHGERLSLFDEKRRYCHDGRRKAGGTALALRALDGKAFGRKRLSGFDDAFSVLGAVIAIVLFMVVPTFLVGLLNKVVDLGGWKRCWKALSKLRSWWDTWRRSALCRTLPACSAITAQNIKRLHAMNTIWN